MALLNDARLIDEECSWNERKSEEVVPIDTCVECISQPIVDLNLTWLPFFKERTIACFFNCSMKDFRVMKAEKMDRPKCRINNTKKKAKNRPKNTHTEIFKPTRAKIDKGLSSN